MKTVLLFAFHFIAYCSGKRPSECLTRSVNTLGPAIGEEMSNESDLIYETAVGGRVALFEEDMRLYLLTVCTDDDDEVMAIQFTLKS